VPLGIPFTAPERTWSGNARKTDFDPYRTCRAGRSIFRGDRWNRCKGDERQADAAEDRVTGQPALDVELVEPASAEIDRDLVHDLELVADQRADCHHLSFERTKVSARTAVAGHLSIDVSANTEGKTGFKMLVDVPLEVKLSWGRLHSPEQLSPEVDEDRVTASATYTRMLGDDTLWSSTLAWGRKINHPGNTLDGFLLESELIFKQTYTLFVRAECVAEEELLENMLAPSVIGPLAPMPVFTVSKISAGGIYDFPVADHLKFGVGALVSKYSLPSALKPFYGGDPTSYMVFLRLKLS
jgi:hypothetical protein